MSNHLERAAGRAGPDARLGHSIMQERNCKNAPRAPEAGAAYLLAAVGSRVALHVSRALQQPWHSNGWPRDAPDGR